MGRHGDGRPSQRCPDLDASFPGRSWCRCALYTHVCHAADGFSRRASLYACLGGVPMVIATRSSKAARPKLGNNALSANTAAAPLIAFSWISSTKAVPCAHRAARGHESPWSRYPRYGTVLQITPTTVMKRKSARTAQSGACITYSASHVSVRLSPLLRGLFPLVARSDYARGTTAKALSSPLPPHGGCSSPILFCPRCFFPNISRAEQSPAPAHPPRHLAEKQQHSCGMHRRNTTVLL